MTLLTGGALLPLVPVILFVTAETIRSCLSHTGKILVTGCALDSGQRMCVVQNKPGPVVTEAARRCLPVTLTVTITALLAQGPVVLVILLVTGQAILGRFLEHHALVTFLAFHFCMLSQQGETAQIVVELLCWFFPASFAVATRAVLAQRTFVLVVLCMADTALLAQLGTVEITGMTACARSCDMLATQSVLGIDVVIELGRLPEIDPMARLAFLTKLTFMALGTIVVLLVAANASARRVLVID